MNWNSLRSLLWSTKYWNQQGLGTTRNSSSDRIEAPLDLTLKELQFSIYAYEKMWHTFIFKNTFFLLAFVRWISAFRLSVFHSAERSFSEWLKRSESHFRSDSFVYSMIWHHRVSCHKFVNDWSPAPQWLSPYWETLGTWHLTNSTVACIYCTFRMRDINIYFKSGYIVTSLGIAKWAKCAWHFQAKFELFRTGHEIKCRWAINFNNELPTAGMSV